MKLQKLKNDLFKKEISKDQQGTINGGTWRLTQCVSTGGIDDCADKRWEGVGLPPVAIG